MENTKVDFIFETAKKIQDAVADAVSLVEKKFNVLNEDIKLNRRKNGNVSILVMDGADGMVEYATVFIDYIHEFDESGKLINMDAQIVTTVQE